MGYELKKNGEVVASFVTAGAAADAAFDLLIGRIKAGGPTDVLTAWVRAAAFFAGHRSAVTVETIVPTIVAQVPTVTGVVQTWSIRRTD